MTKTLQNYKVFTIAFYNIPYILQRRSLAHKALGKTLQFYKLHSLE